MIHYKVLVLKGGNYYNLFAICVVMSSIICKLVHLACAGFELSTLVVIDTDRIGSYKSNDFTITTTTTPTRLIRSSLI